MSFLFSATSFPQKRRCEPVSVLSLFSWQVLVWASIYGSLLLKLSRRNTRLAETTINNFPHSLSVPKPKRRFHEQSFYLRTAHLWNTLLFCLLSSWLQFDRIQVQCKQILDEPFPLTNPIYQISTTNDYYGIFRLTTLHSFTLILEWPLGLDKWWLLYKKIKFPDVFVVDAWKFNILLLYIFLWF